MEQAGIAEELVEEFVGHLERRGRGSYTARSYRLGLADFSRWLTGVSRPLVEVSRRDVETYIGEFAAGPGTATRASGVVDLATGQPVPVRRAARTVNHRLSVLASFFAFLIDRDTEDGGAWAGRVSPVPARAAELTHSMGGGGDAPPRRKRAELRRRESRDLPSVLDPAEVERLVGAARSWRDKALLVLLSRSGQRIGDWSLEHGRHGVLGMSMADLDRRASTIVVRLKGARDEHRVPVTGEFLRLFDLYLEHERRDAPGEAAWVGLRRGWPNPLTYSAFEAALRQLATRTRIEVTAHMFRHTVATEVVATSGVAAAQQLLGHRHIATTVDTYAHVDQQALVAAVSEIERQARAAAENARRMQASGRPGRIDGPQLCVPLRLPDVGRVGGDRHAPPHPGPDIRRGRGTQGMTGAATRRARQLGTASYDRQVLIEHLTAQMRGWRFNKRNDDNRMLLAVHATFDVLDTLDGASLAERWATFEEQVWPRWQTGIDRPDRGTRWGFGAWALVISRLVRPQWATIATVRIGDWTRLLPADDQVIEARQRLAEAAGSCSIGSPKSYDIAITMATRLMLTRGVDRLDDLSEDDLLIPPSGMKGGDVLDVLLCQLGVFDRTPRSGTARRRTAARHSERELAVVAGVPEPFVEVVGLYLETYARRLSDSYTTLRAKAVALSHFFRYLHDAHPEVTSCSQVTPAQARAFVSEARVVARATQRSHPRKGTEDRTTPHTWLIDIRVFFADISTWATEPDSPFAGHAPSSVVLTRHDLADTGFAKARKRAEARLTSTVLDLQREMPNIRAFALRRWHDAEHALHDRADDKTLIAAERAAFWDWGLLELLLTSGLRIEEACELTTFDVLRRSLPDGRLYYLLHIKPSKFGRARVIPIGDQLGRAIAEIIRHVRGFYGADHVPLVDRRDEHEKRPLPRAPYLLQGIRHPSAVNTNTIRGRLRWLSEQSGARHADGAPLVLTPHDCRRVFASEHLNAHTPVHVIQALLGHATIDTVMIYAKLYPDQFITDYRKAMRGLYTDVYGPDANQAPTKSEWAEFTASCSMRDMGTHVCALPTGEHCPRGLVCLGCGHAQPKKSALPVFRRMLTSHTRALDKAREHGEPAGQIASRELEVERIRAAMQRAQELSGDAAEALEAAAAG